MTIPEPGDTATAELTPDELRDEIEQTREEVGETIEALTAKLDVKARTKDKLGHARDEAATRLRSVARQTSDVTGRAMERVGFVSGGPSPRTLALAAVVAMLLTGLGVGTWKRRHG